MNYLEAHISVDGRSPTITQVGRAFGFWVSELLVEEGDDKPGFFLTSRDSEETRLASRCRDLITELRKHEVKVLRYKIEKTIVDSKFGDPWACL